MGDILGKLISLYEIALLIRIVLSWVPHNPYNQAVQFLYKITDPVLNPVRKLIPPFRGIDFSPVIVFVGLGLAKRIVGECFNSQQFPNSMIPISIAPQNQNQKIRPNSTPAFMKGKKLIVMDVDGVLFKGQFILHAARSLGILVYLRAALLCLLFNMDKISIQELITRVYAHFKGVTIGEARRIYEKIPVIKHARETIETLRKHGYLVVLISSGVPDLFVKDLAARLSANHGYGLEIVTDTDRLTGTVLGQLLRPGGKKVIIEEILSKNNLSWQNTVVLVDDRNNSDIMERASVIIGVNAHYAVRQRAQYLIDSGNLSDVLDIMDVEDADTYKILSAGMRKQFAHSWYQEIRRKLLHILIAFAPLFASFIYHTTLIALFSLLLIYLISECLRVNGYSFPLFGGITRSSIRKLEERGFAFGPITLVLGASLCLLLFPSAIASTVIWIVAFADTAAAIVGMRLGNHRIPYNIKKSIEGSCAAWIVAFVCGSIYLPLFPALLTASFASIIESLPLRSLDNLLMPIGAGAMLLCLGYS